MTLPQILQSESNYNLFQLLVSPQQKLLYTFVKGRVAYEILYLFVLKAPTLLSLYMCTRNPSSKEPSLKKLHFESLFVIFKFIVVRYSCFVLPVTFHFTQSKIAKRSFSKYKRRVYCGIWYIQYISMIQKHWNIKWIKWK